MTAAAGKPLSGLRILDFSRVVLRLVPRHGR